MKYKKLSNVCLKKCTYHGFHSECVKSKLWNKNRYRFNTNLNDLFYAATSRF